ncbi:DUF3267 domain-containing protein [Listeria cossartiae]|uniref:DUF3267 domain-containing protein n=1 Tax=Listeria cossartiae TaxID=2838249 RepID=UPI001628F042|nr:DUF3267 domain-containing protein [Listeria cossartiae]MBC1543117.1 DUF3267 domain-containing protein [Listeria cossartiae subsp. cossartiae]MBC1548226.1 DUF3267 domain-containing protein [Listeria cossartiae subsp. cossartiae]MBC1550149.1 DUF3267 domain-containing protein [Listeria cossartiae subsp. cossartiae]MBC1567881.1 DUF3267 domain-containing protein [Listeria cossartiae subsp. cossartiae]MBC1571036.1 DUF3267 domain-containing protein [Listeria cossartiae subsp. cossartiae]
MNLIKEINLLTNKKMIVWLNFLSVLLLIVFAILAWRVSVRFTPTVSFDRDELYYIIQCFVMFILLILIHEFIHGFFFKVFSPKNKVKYGFKNMMFYATSPKSFYSKRKFYCISLAPFIFVTIGLTLLFLFGVIPSTFYIFLVSFHGAGCTGDFYWAWVLFKSSKDTIIEDTEVGINLYTNV